MLKHTIETMTYTKWFRMLNNISEKEYSVNLDRSKSSWREFYDDGYTPREALDEDTYAGV